MEQKQNSAVSLLLLVSSTQFNVVDRGTIFTVLVAANNDELINEMSITHQVYKKCPDYVDGLYLV